MRFALLALILALSAPIPVFTAAPTVAEARSSSCGSDYYRNSRGRCVHRPQYSSSVPSGASARCRDGTYSFSQSRRGTCSHHGGVAAWL